MNQPLRFPAVYCPLPTLMHPDVEEIGRISWERFTSSGVMAETPEKLEYHRSQDQHLWISQGYANGIAERVIIVTQFFYCSNWEDHVCDDAGPLAKNPGEVSTLATHLHRAMERPYQAPAKDEAWTRAHQDACRRFAEEGATNAQVARFTTAWRAYFLGLICELALKARPEPASLNDFMVARLQCGLLAPFATLLDWADGYEVPAEDFASPAVQALIEMTTILICWDNDFFSRNKEHVRDGRVGPAHNLVEILAYHENVTDDEALAQAVGMRDRVMVRFLELGAQLKEHAGTEVQRYVDGLGNMVRTNIDWSHTTARYLNPRNLATFSLPDPAHRYSDKPANTTPGPLPIPCIAWWWDDLLG
ncbi:hypothetical protein [Streptomyces sp. TBY4]|uniref:terpene synthase family protein n=1 Tax=Streptomyces sp. TBY4 TaxID=2962030 RepID=UPI0020B70E78|nr:hypothetical protein [Streptomyces sp. TBY4]MCP3757024.1 hypothetical protein [Streptomyces sp. TBY4]